MLVETSFSFHGNQVPRNIYQEILPWVIPVDLEEPAIRFRTHWNIKRCRPTQTFPRKCLKNPKTISARPQGLECHSPLYKFWEKLNIWIKVFGRIYVHALNECEWSNFKFKYSRWFISAAEIRADWAPPRPCALASAKQVRVLARLTELGQCSPSAGQTGLQRDLRMSVYVSWRFKASHFYLAIFKAIFGDAWILVVALLR